MPLRDHFRSPVNDKHTWNEVHGLWPAMIVREMFDALPAGYQASPRINLASPSPTFTLEADLSEQDEYEVRIYDDTWERKLVAAIEIVSPSNKDRPEKREMFVAKCASLLQNDVCVSIIDLVTVRHFNLCAELLELLNESDSQLGTNPHDVYSVSLRARKRAKKPSLLDVWFYPMKIGETLPTLPIWLSPESRVLFPLEPSYEETCRLLRIK